MHALQPESNHSWMDSETSKSNKVALFNKIHLFTEWNDL